MKVNTEFRFYDKKLLGWESANIFENLVFMERMVMGNLSSKNNSHKNSCGC